jgi:hypothetical protein
MLFFAMMIALNASSQTIPAEDFKTHILMISENEDIQKKYQVEEEGNRVVYFNLGNYEVYHQKEPIKNRFGEVFLWDEGTIAFRKIPYTLDLLRIREEGDNLVFYELTYDDGKEKNFMEIKFVKRYQDWELVDVAISKVKKAY